MHVFYFIFVHFRLFPVFDFGLVHFTSQPKSKAVDLYLRLLQNASDSLDQLSKEAAPLYGVEQ